MPRSPRPCRDVARRLVSVVMWTCAACSASAERRVAPGGPVDIPIPPLAVAPPVDAGPVAADASAHDLRAGLTRLSDAAEAAIDARVAEALAAHKLPGCVVVVGRRDRVLFQRAYGSRSIEPTVTPMTLDTVFDLASLTKPLATASSVVLLADRGLVDLDAQLRSYLPELGDRGAATVRQTLTHTAGFVADTALADYATGPDEALRRIARASLRYAPGTDARYSDVGFIVLGELVRRVTGRDLARFSHDEVFAPLGMGDTGFLPGPALAARAAPTERVLGRWLQGEVHDPRARALGGVAGHAGVFSTGGDLARFAQAMLGAPGGPLTPAVRRIYTAPHDVPKGVRALGWDVRSAFSSNRGVTLSPRAFGHGGFTGTSLWIDPTKDLFIVFLSHRVHPTGHGEVNPLAGAIADIAAAEVSPEVAAVVPPASACRPASARGPLMTGLDVLVAERFAPLAGAHVGLITNASGRSREGARDVDLLASEAARAAGVTLVAVFAPEHGLASDQDAVIADGRDATTGLPVYSLYGDHFTPNDAELAGIDTLVLNLPDVGARFFTYASTMHRALGAAAKRGLRFVVLDRPDPVDGVQLEGPLLTGTKSFVNHARLPVRHGMTMGELALLFDATDHAGTSLEVIPLRGWQADRAWLAPAEGGLAWLPPSPNLRTPVEALLYPGVALLEATNVSVGRGTETPFEVVGAPWMDGAKVVAELGKGAATLTGLRGVAFEPVTFTPTSSRYRGQRCLGVKLTVTDASALQPVALGVTLAVALRRVHPDAWERKGLVPLLASKEAIGLIEGGAPAEQVSASWATELADFAKTRERYLLYPRRACVDTPSVP